MKATLKRLLSSSTCLLYTSLQILRTLQENARLTTKELAARVSLSSTPVFERLKRLDVYKRQIILGDGMADWPVKSLGDKTLLQYAKTPYMDKLARLGRNGRLITVAEGFHPGLSLIHI